MASQVLVAANRGPLSYALSDDGTLSARRGGGGLVSGLSAALAEQPGALWICAALSDADREAVRRDVSEPGVRMLDIDPTMYDDAYNGIANSVLWFTHHHLYDVPREPVFDAEFRRRWGSYVAYNEAFARALAEEAAQGARVLVQDYHLALVPGQLRELRPDLRIAHFTHTPWASQEFLRMLPDDIRSELVWGMLGADVVGFHTWAWAHTFMDGAHLDDERGIAEPKSAAGVEPSHARYVHKNPSGPVRHKRTEVAVYPLGVDAEELRALAHRPEVDAKLAELRAQVAGRRTIARVDRTELSKNILRGLLAYRELLTVHPEWRGRVVHLASAYPSRQDLKVYRDYTAAVAELAAEINAEFGTEDWQPVLVSVKDDFARSLAVYRMADVALVNPVRDGMNLVAKEIPVVSEAGCAVVLSTGAGAYEELREDALTVNPYDVSQTAEALHAALSMPDEERAERTKRLAAAATALPPAQWFTAQLSALEA
ncbi:alpha,alpha-trehalose-phosphate synthase [Streptomyces sp. WM6373]|uniref:alpha,alpha-trehalose-phosphate synthase (UDP-forming) n=1 Tax=Streptomyces TaxID=1883 RepID=UPI0006AF531E|nr:MULTISPECIES: trehalose-6-phosphate synthase [unclassified Streptomyces]KOU30388.1 alpha,alpha-trehalose-phosphate synthase [Streptomyces sp. WM6373]KOU61574.1 alpha,alpha-trehalose-phosphate synthase [Streptomyces sp. IGB124]KOU82667.1 alpha,alpha-trehalose-phosphate synthase [Streptomyces sp. XY58]KOV03387.1 alpha,alpha-trehalose-phosphate synthase [Streptomyces sp. XY37]KOV18066.1 alpha,alpha-trehalose-phosphate synthase [Streptomyces sp. XY413]